MVDLLAAVFAHQARIGGPFIVGGDFNLDVELLQTGAGPMRVIDAGSTRCSGDSWNKTDYFISADVRLIIRSVETLDTGSVDHIQAGGNHH